ncbi:hypothetical protein BKG82_06560 [Mycobacteroides chelonae]|uniref:Uncharacterized protein n=1 Tax=Mycobacteroides chelonae TaxID=1774 RepID=A0A1S1LWQ7_MYCCH|nr:hypothetical protein AOT87_02415 [Mycobacteroides sp. H003]KRQ28720.1 hypothetical protein AOT91_18065 [Mycobacteroides sp. H092]KRQ44131.1 hypothetical protein AOT92_07365 [Mycobacteroides sp. H101]KRQ51001.1 hypothetical protein AOT88_06310 [Mycobacteroides sp. H063]KRQ57466.1 hypothetical protein AOT94_15960 [Mycobacteroides sp. HXVII]KRQ61853.1 hypothetical protein AOT90_17305 [Mycobacteroides sp. H079]KRQ74725.1 hypothetical protein AOT95_27920 [Mycobacteroides sp. HXXIII]KRQ82115.1 
MVDGQQTAGSGVNLLQFMLITAPAVSQHRVDLPDSGTAAVQPRCLSKGACMRHSRYVVPVERSTEPGAALGAGSASLVHPGGRDLTASEQTTNSMSRFVSPKVKQF